MYAFSRSRWFFFFQAEDGIRDGHVTGVQTCALPIYASLGVDLVEQVVAAGDVPNLVAVREAQVGEGLVHPAAVERRVVGNAAGVAEARVRSEERRVGKEWRCRWSA